MRLRPEQLAGHLQGGLLPAYLVAGDEPLLVQEAADAVRAAARRAGCEERVVLEGGPGCDWARLREEARALSLFASRRLVELRLPSPRPGEAGARALQAWAEDPPPGDVLLVTAPRLDREAQRARWVAALEAAGALVAVWPVERARYPAWVRARLEAAGFRPEPEAVAALAERTEGNLLACAQAVERLALLRPGGGALDEGAVLEAVAGGARYGVFELAERALAGDAAGAARALAALRAEGTEPALVLWAVARELRALLGQSGGRGGPAPRGPAGRRREAAHRAALARRGRRGWEALLARGARIDRVVKGLEPAPGGRLAPGPGPAAAWEELLQWILTIAGAAGRAGGGAGTGPAGSPAQALRARLGARGGPAGPADGSASRTPAP